MRARADLPAALSRHRAPDFTIKSAHEILLLRGLSLLARAVFDELLALADHVTGAIRTNYAVLASLVAIDPPASGPRPELITKKHLRTALIELRERGLVRFDQVKNEKVKRLILRIEGRKGKAASSGKLGPQLGPHRNGAKQATARVTKEVPTETRTRTRDGGSREPISISKVLERELSTDAVAAMRQLKHTRAELAGGPKKRPPHGG